MRIFLLCSFLSPNIYESVGKVTLLFGFHDERVVTLVGELSPLIYWLHFIEPANKGLCKAICKIPILKFALW